MISNMLYLLYIFTSMFLMSKTFSMSLPTDEEISACQDIELDTDCACVLEDSSILCCNPANETFLCIQDSENATDDVTALAIIFSPITRLSLTKGVLERLGIRNVAKLTRLRVGNTSISEIHICKNKNTSEEDSARYKRSYLPSIAKTEFWAQMNYDMSTDDKLLTMYEYDDDMESSLVDCEEFESFSELDVRGNKLKHLHKMNLQKLQRLFLSGNAWSCFHGGRKHSMARPEVDMDWIRDSELSVQDQKSTFCTRPPSTKWHQNNSKTNVTLMHFLEFNKEVELKCPSNCSCNIININDPLCVKVTCSGLNLTHLPEVLPPNTIVLNVSHNQITSLQPLRDNLNYAKLKQLIAQFNSISSMDELKGSQFAKNKPTTLNLQSNKLKKFDTELIKSILTRIDTHHDSVNFLFADNPWECSCDKVKSIQNFIYEYKIWLRDSDILACDLEQEAYLVSFDYNSFCPIESTVDYMAILVVFEVILLIIILSKLSYDVLQYRRTGELPWLARHICLGYSYSSIKESNGRSSQNSGGGFERRGGTPDDDAIQFVHTNSDSPTSSISKSQTGNNTRCLAECLVCVSGDVSDDGSKTRSTNNIPKGDVVTFRPRRHTEKSSVSYPSELINGTNKSPTPLSVFNFRKISKGAPPTSPLKSPTQSVQTRTPTLPKLFMPNHLISGTNMEPTFEIEDEERIRPFHLRGLKGSSSEDRLSFRRTVMEPMPNSMHSQTFASFGHANSIKRNISKSTSTLQNSVAL